jgi:hypothetical protein
VSKFVFSLDGGRRGILENAKDLCSAGFFATARFVGQNNRGEALSPRLAAKCPKHKAKRRRRGR